LLAASPWACRRASAPLLTYFDGAHALSLGYPAGWRTEQAEQQGVWYRYFAAPPETGSTSPASVSVTVLAGRLAGSLQDYAQVYLADKTLTSSQPERRQGAQGMSYAYGSAGGQKRHRLLLLEEHGNVYGLYAEGDARRFEREEPAVTAMFASFALERPASYPERRDDAGRFAIGLPPSWTSGRSLSSGERRVAQFLSPPLQGDRPAQAVRASLTISVEPLDGADLEGYYVATRQLLGGSFEILDHAKWKGGYADVVRTETPIAASRSRRYYRVADGRGYALAFEAREDVFQDVVAWFEMIAWTFKCGSELDAGARH
jgi:hypothetical protein